MNWLATTTLLGYFLIGGLAFAYGHERSRQPQRQQAEAVRTAEIHKSQAEERAVRVPADEPITIDLRCLSVDKAGVASLEFNTRWGDWRKAQTTLAAGKGKPATARIDLDWCRLEITPQFSAGRRASYDVKLAAGKAGLMGRFRIAETGKQVTLQEAATPGYLQRLVFYDPERRVTTYRLVSAGANKRQDACGIVFLGKGWSAVEETKRVAEGPGYIFPEVQIVVLPQAWMEGNDIGDVMKSLKRGIETRRTD